MKRSRLVWFGLALLLGAFVPLSARSAGPTKPARGGTLNLATNIDFKSLDPALMNDGQHIPLSNMLYANLLRYQGNTLSGKLVADIAASIRWAPDGKAVTFILKDGLKFSDGSPITAEDVAFSITRILDPKTKAGYQGAFKVISGAQDFIDGKAADVSGLVVKDAKTIEFKLNALTPHFLHVLALPSGNVVSKKAAEANPGFQADKLVTSGAFILKKWAPGQTVELERNPNYYDKTRPYLDKVVFKVNVPVETQMLMFDKGELDVVTPVPPAEFIKLQGDPAKMKLYMKYPGPRMYYAGMNVNLPPFDQKLVRQALNYAVDKDRILQIINGRGIKMGSTLPPWMPGHDAKIKPYVYDVKKAKELLKKAGLEKGFSVDLLVPDYAYQPQVAAQVQADLAKVGITVNYQVQPLATVRTQLRTPNKVPFFQLQWGTDFPDPSNVISTLFNSASGLNFAYFKNSKVDELIAKADGEKDAKKRLALFNQADKTIVEEAPWIFLFYGISDGLKSAKIFPNDPSFFVDPLGSRKIDSVWKAK